MTRLPLTDTHCPEGQLLLACARSVMTANDQETIRQLLSSPLDETHFSELVRYHGLSGLVWKNLKLFGEEIPTPLRLHLEHQAIKQCLKNQRYAQALIQAVSALKNAGIEAVPFKGPLLSQIIYGNISSRSFCDLDLLVRLEDMETAVEILATQGYEWLPTGTVSKQRIDFPQIKDIPLNKKQGNITIELHWRLEQKSNEVNQADEAWGRLMEVTFEGQAVQTLGYSDLFLQLCVHGAAHVWFKLKWICDIAEFIRAQPATVWPEIIDHARRSRAQRRVALALLLAEKVLGANLPEEVVPFVRRHARLLKQVRTVQKLSNKAPSPLLQAKFTWDTKDTWRDRAYFATYQLKPTATEKDWVKLPPSLGLFYYIIRPLRIFLRYVVGLNI